MDETRSPAAPLKVLYENTGVQACDAFAIDIVVVHGIGADPDRTWRKGDCNWLSDESMLPSAIPNARILRFAYESQWLGRDTVQQRLPLVADQLLSSFVQARKGYPTRPLMFVGHCFGGLVIQKAVIASRLHARDYPGICDSVSGIAFLGTPNRGSDSQSKAAIIASMAAAAGLGEHSRLLRMLEPESEALRDLLNDFMRLVIADSIPLTCFFELHKSNIAKLVLPKSMSWIRQTEMVVDEVSSCIEGFPRFGLAADHFNIHRYNGPNDGNFQIVREELARLAAAARSHMETSHVASRNEDEKTQSKDEDCLSALFLTDPEEDMNIIETRTDKMLQDTSTWFFRHAAFVKWTDSSEHDVLWVHGDPGKGKTFIAIATVRDLSHKLRSVASPENHLLLYFFCDNKDNRRNTATAIMRGLLYQLFTQRPDLCHLLRSEYAKRKEQLLSAPTALHTLWHLLQVAAESQTVDRIYIVIDALDECEEASIADLLSLINDTGSRHDSAISLDGDGESPSMKWMILSRNEESIRQEMYDVLDISLEQNAEHVANSVSEFIMSRLGQLKRMKRYSESLTSEVQAMLCERAEGTFLWVALACRELAKPKVRSMNTKAVLAKLPAGLTALYDELVEQLLNNDDNDLVRHATHVLQAMVVALRPLNLWELAVAAGLPKDSDMNEQMIMDYLDLCSSVVGVRDGTAYFVHESAQEYLLSRTDIMPLDRAVSHADVALRCYDYVCGPDPDQADGETLSAAKEGDDEPPTEVDAGGGDALEYPTMFWLEHMRLGDTHVHHKVDIDGHFLSVKSIARQDWLDLYWPKRYPPWEKQPSEFAAIHLASFGGLTWLVKAVLEARDDNEIHLQDSLGQDALIWAASRGWHDTVEYLVKNCANLMTQNDRGLTALYLAALSGHSKTAEALIKGGANVECCDRRGATLVHCVTAHGHLDILQLLLDANATVDVRDGRNRTAIQWACSKGGLAAVKVLHASNANMSQMDREGMTLLHHAAGHGHSDIATFLLSDGAEINAKCYGGWAPLHEAAWNGETSIAAFLMKRGADVMLRTLEGHTPLQQAAFNGHLDCVRLLVQGGADVDAICHDGDTALHQAAWNGHDDILKLLIAYGASVSTKNNDGRTALDYAIANDCEVAVHLLLAAKAQKMSISETAHINDFSRQQSYSNEQLRKPSKPPAFKDVHRNDRDPPIELDPAIAEAIPGQPVSCDCHHHGHAGFSVPLKVRATYAHGSVRCFFCKTYGNEAMFRSEFFSLKTLSDTVPTVCPAPLVTGRMRSTDHCFLLTEYIDADDPACQEQGSGRTLAEKLAMLHNSPVVPPSGQTKPHFGFPVSTFCGATPQDNHFSESWPDFFGQRRLGVVGRIVEEHHGSDEELRTWIDRTITIVVPALLREGHLGGEDGIKPSLVHGDLWMGNRLAGKVDSWVGIEETTFDPSSTYAHHEYEFAIMRLFGGFLASFWSRYHAVKPKTEPKDEYEDRISLYSVYHLLVHYATDVGGWREEAIEVMQMLWEKYGTE